MTNRKTIYFSLLFLLAIATILAEVIYNCQSQKLKVVFLDVGQGDSILIEQGSNQLLIDGGADGKKVMEKLGEYVPFWDRKIEVVLATHPDQDHIGGLLDVVNNYQIGEVVDNGVASSSDIYKKFKDLIEQRKIGEVEGKVGMNIQIGPDAKLAILSPDGTQEKNNPKDTNVSSIVSKLMYLDHSFLFTGDFSTDGELALLGSKSPIGLLEPKTPIVAGISTTSNVSAWHADVLKVGHHGSKYATSNEFLDAVRPTEAVISVGKSNRYGHPSSEVLDRLQEHKINIKRTDQVGDVEYNF